MYQQPTDLHAYLPTGLQTYLTTDHLTPLPNDQFTNLLPHSSYQAIDLTISQLTYVPTILQTHLTDQPTDLLI